MALLNITLARTSLADSTCGDALGTVYCETAIRPVRPSSPGVIGGSEYIADSVACGPRRTKIDDTPLPGDVGCANYLPWCPLAPGTRIDPTKQIVAYTIYDTATHTLLRLDIACDVTTATALPSLPAITAETTRRAPQPHTTAGGTQYLINTAIVFYTTPPPGTADLTDLTIPRFTLAGHSFTIRLHLHTTTWTWGDTTTSTYPNPDTTSPPPGRPYQHSTPCETNTHCSHYIAHTYTHPATYTIHAQAHWSATFTLDNNPQQIPIPGDIHRTDTTGHTITTHQATSHLTPPTPNQ